MVGLKLSSRRNDHHHPNTADQKGTTRMVASSSSVAAEPISAARYALVRKCCSLAEGFLMKQRNIDDEDNKDDDFDTDVYTPDWSTLEPAFLQQFQDWQEHPTTQPIDWENIPPSLRPESPVCQLDDTRAHHKRLQLQALPLKRRRRRQQQRKLY